MQNLSICTLNHYPDLIDETVDLINESFGYQETSSFQIDFYPLLNREQWENNHLLMDKENRVLGHIGVRKKYLSINQIKIPVLFMGGFCLDNSVRGKRIFPIFLQKVIELHKDKVALLMLWSDKVDFYKKLGFASGMSFKQSLPKKRTSAPFDDRIHLEQTKFHKLSDTDLDQVKELYRNYLEQKFHTIHRSNADWQNILNISSADLFLIRASDEIKAYYVKNKGQDLTNIVHEFACKDDFETEFMSYLKNKNTIWYPETFDLLDSPENNLHFMALMRKGSDNMFSNFVNVVSNGQIKLTHSDDENVAFTFNGENYNLNLLTFYSLLLGPSPADEFKTFFKSWFISGLDSL